MEFHKVQLLFSFNYYLYSTYFYHIRTYCNNSMIRGFYLCNVHTKACVSEPCTQELLATPSGSIYFELLHTYKHEYLSLESVSLMRVCCCFSCGHTWIVLDFNIIFFSYRSVAGTFQQLKVVIMERLINGRLKKKWLIKR